VEFSTPSVSAPSFATALALPRPFRKPWRAAGGHRLQEWILRTGNPHVRFLETRGHGYVVVDVTADRVRAEWWHVASVSRRSPSERRVAAWSAARGDPRLLPE
jgi:hypothetical protein